MKYLSLLILVCLHVSTPTSAQPMSSMVRKAAIEKMMENVSDAKAFLHLVDTLHLSIGELSDYPVLFPVKRDSYAYYTSSNYGKRQHPIYHIVKNHTGIDIAQAKGSPVYATGNGRVKTRGYNSGYGYYVEVEHRAGFSSFYAHLQKIVVNVGDAVKMGEQIATVGNTGVSTGSHLHYEVRKSKQFLEPKSWCYVLFTWLSHEK